MTEPVYVAIYSENLIVGGERPIKRGNSWLSVKSTWVKRSFMYFRPLSLFLK
jgi:hypothetical protein